MTLSTGTRLGPYEVVGPLGAGGMGEVYRARDTRLDRDVALKILPDSFAANEMLRARFEREAKTISSLNHPNICTLHDVGRHEGAHYLVMEMIEGESLADRLARGPVPVDQVVRYGAQIADALDHAHRQGIIHRDLKPGNIMITKAGAKLLDFGLARMVAGEQPVQGLTTHPTEVRPLTTEGTILGTFQYMAPEQLEGVEIDGRADIFALGAVIFEMATGRKAFTGESKTSLIAAIVASQPPPIASLQPMTPTALDHVVRKCLEKSPDDRWQSAHDVAASLRWIGEAGSQAGVAAPVTARRQSRERLGWALAGILAMSTAALGLAYVLRDPAPGRLVRATLSPPVGSTLVPFDLLGVSLSPDGSTLAFAANSGEGKRSLYVRRLDEPDARALPETEGASYPFWSPDGGYLGFFADGKLRRIDLRGGAPQTLADAPSGRGGSWNAAGTILFAPSTRSSIMKVPAAGGATEEVTTFDPEMVTTHRWPVFLPDGSHFLFVSRARREGRLDVAQLMVGSLDSHEAGLLIDDASNAAYVEPGFVVYGRSANLYAQAFDVGRRSLIGDPIPLTAEKLSYWEPKNLVVFAASNDGTIVYLPATDRKSLLQWYDRDGRVLGTIGSEGFHADPRISFDGAKVAFLKADVPQGLADIWIQDLDHDRLSRFTLRSGQFSRPTWSRDGGRLAFVCAPRGVADICVKPVRDAGQESVLFESRNWKDLGSFMPGDEALVITDQDPETGFDVLMLPVAGDREPKAILRTPFSETVPEASPDGRWVAYRSDQTGRMEVMVRSSSGSPGEWQISTEGGGVPRWRGDGKELFFVAPDGIVMAAPVETSPAFRPGVPRALFRLPEPPDELTPLFGDVTPDGGRIIAVVPIENRSSIAFRMILNWTALVQERPR